MSAGHARFQNQLDAEGRYSDAQNIEAEAELIGAMLIDNELIDLAAEKLKPDDFYLPLHARMAHAIWRQHARGKVVSPVTLKPIFDRDKSLEELGGIKYLAELTAMGNGLLSFDTLVDQIGELAKLREIKFAADRMMNDYLSGEVGFDQAVGGVDQAMNESLMATAATRALSAGEMVQRVIDRSDKITENGMQENIGLRCTTVSDMNTMLAPLELGTYIVIGGRPSMGKSTLAASLARGYAANGHPTLYGFAEGTEDKLAMRFVADLSLDSDMPLTTEQIQKDKLTREERAHYERLLEEAKVLPIDYHNIGRCDIAQLRRYAARADAKWRERGQRLEVLVVDYMQLLGASQNGREIENERSAVNAVSAGLLKITQDIGCTVIALSQLTRSLETRDDKRPRLSDLRESGRIEEDADAVMFVYRDEYYLERVKPERGRKDFDDAYNDWQADLARARNRVDLILAKNRDGSVKTRTCKFFGAYTAIRGGDFEPPANASEELAF